MEKDPNTAKLTFDRVHENYNQDGQYIYVDMTPYAHLFDGYMTGPVDRAQETIDNSIDDVPPIVEARVRRYSGNELPSLDSWLRFIIPILEEEAKDNHLYLYHSFLHRQYFEPNDAWYDYGWIRYGKLPR